MQNLLAYWRSVVEDGILRVPYSVDAKFSFIDIQDLAEVAKIVLKEEGYRSAVYELAGTAPTTHVDVAYVFKKVLGREVKAEKEEIEDWRLRTIGLSEYALENLTRMFEYYDQWGLIGNPNILKWILKREPASLEVFINRVAKKNNANN